ncbi:MAG: dihydropteroate synthase [Pyrinomonadaceae bacterium]|nr:dihydropteroate synthase [Pyrinomonadaceae bacterium]
MNWKTSRRVIGIERPLVMGILNVTPDSFSDGGRYTDIDRALAHAERMIAEGADIIDIGGESTRPGSEPVSPEDEVARVVPVISAIARRFDVPISVDTWKADVAERAAEAGAEIINDISGLRWDPRLAAVAAETGTGLVLMHSRGDFGTMHSTEPADDIFADVTADHRRAISAAGELGVSADHIALDIGIGFGKTLEQNLQLMGGLKRIVDEFAELPVLVGASRKSFIAKVADGIPADERLPGSLAAAAISVVNGAMILRVHDVKETVQAVRVATAIVNA